MLDSRGYGNEEALTAVQSAIEYKAKSIFYMMVNIYMDNIADCENAKEIWNVHFKEHSYEFWHMAWASLFKGFR